jgi:hypothetical protein
MRTPDVHSYMYSFERKKDALSGHYIDYKIKTTKNLGKSAANQKSEGNGGILQDF